MDASEANAAAREVKVTVSILTFNAAERIRTCLDAVRVQSRPADEVIVIDNASSDDTVAIVEQEYPDVRVERSSRNTGCSGGRNRQIRYASHRWVLIVDDDAFLEPSCLEHLVKGVGTLPDAAIWAPRVCYEQDPNTVQYDGGEMHYTGEIIAINPERPLHQSSEAESDPHATHQIVHQAHREAEPLPSEPFVTTIQGGVAYMVDRDVVLGLGGYDEDFFFGRSDGEMSFRLSLAGHRVYTVPQAIVYHRFKPRGLKNIRNQVRNRWTVILVTYSWRTILVLIPAFLAYELMLLAFLASKGSAGQYFAGNWQVLRDLPAIVRKRRQAQRQKRRRDREVLSAGFMNMRSDIAGGAAVRTAFRLVNGFFQGYWACARWAVA